MTPPTATTVAAENPKAYRLPTSVRPLRYDVALDARPDRDTFTGSVAIQLHAAAPTLTVELHARDLQIAAARLVLPGRTLDAAVRLDPARELARVYLAEPLPLGDTATLELDYTGTLSQGLEGLFLSKNGPDIVLCSQCEVTGARAIFPCFDEPAFKARLAWRITTAPDLTVLTNAPLVSVAPSLDGASQTWTFAPTAPISSYLAALAIGDLASSPERVVNGVPLRIWALRGKEHLGQFALDWTARLLPFFEDYFAAPYHFAKLDQVGVPAFGAGAMENPGLIISLQAYLLLDPQTSSRRQELLAAMVIAHEFAHMWFGNLVTMRWWDDIWLNESFADWMAYHAVDALAPQYRIWDELRPGADGALASDALATSHPIYNPVATPRDINENFDPITYEKGKIVLRMVHDFLGDDAFRAGLRAYMREFAEANATGADLWRNLQGATHQPVGEIIQSWVLQAGHPLIHVALDPDAAPRETRLRLAQRRFFASPDAPASDQRWLVPLAIRYEDDAGTHELHHLLAESETSIHLPVSGDLLWVYANAPEVGFYRQQLDPALLARLAAHLDRLTPAEQKGLLRDQWALVAAGRQPITAYLDVLAALARRAADQTLIADLVNTHLHRVSNLLELAGDEPALASFRAWVAELFADKLAALGPEPQPGESVATGQVRASLLDAMTRYAQDPAAIQQVRAGQEREAADPAAVDANLAPVFVGATAQFGDAATYDRYATIYDQRRAGGYTPEQVERYALATVRFQQPELLARTFRRIEADDFPFQLVYGMLRTMLAEPRTAAAAWDFLKRYWPTVEARAPFMAPIIVESTGALPGALRDDVAAFWEAHLHGENAGPLARALEQIAQNADLQARTRADLLARFREPTSTSAQ